MKKVFVAGHKGLVGSALVRRLKADVDVELITAEKSIVDLSDASQVSRFFASQDFDQVYLAAAKVGGIYANNTFPADFIQQNLSISLNVIHNAFLTEVERLIFLGSSCIYPKYAEQPIGETQLLTGPLEPTNEPYAIAKIAGVKLCESYNRQYGTDYRSLMPTNLYGINDNFDRKNSHVIPGLIRRFHEAKVNNYSEVEIWGTGESFREFMDSDDLADAAVHVMNMDKEIFDELVKPQMSHINVGSGEEISIKDLAIVISQVVGFGGNIKFDPSMPNGAPRKIVNSELLKSTGWQPKIRLNDGILNVYQWLKETDFSALL